MTHQLVEADRLVPFTARADIRAALVGLGRAEDLCFSPDGSKLAVAGLGEERLLILDVETALDGDVPRVALTRFLEVECAAFSHPHGLAWIDEATLVVANRKGPVAIVAIHDVPDGSRIIVEPLRLIGADGTELVRTPGSVAVGFVGMGLIELLVCNNFVEHVTRHLLDQRRSYEVIASEILLDHGLGIPDGIAQSPSSRWIAVSDHSQHDVVLLRSDAQANGAREPDGRLTDLCYPHGIKFGADERVLLVADAGAPFVRLFTSDTGDWSGTRSPSEAIRVMSDATFALENHTPSEGGPKGIDLTRDNMLMVMSCQQQPIAFFDMRGLIATNNGTLPPGEEADAAERIRAVMGRYLLAASERARRETETLRRAGDYDREALADTELEIRKIFNSRSWKLTHPLRSANARIGRLRRRG
ncbi:MAG: hypothetical protein JWN69_2029 [Alphaproteobacteria bacterium]|nr:hypothetical protein [Alphaproteobacteria bacterium]